MADGATGFLSQWVIFHVFSASRSLDELSETVEQCVAEALEEGVTRDDLEQTALVMAGCNLTKYIEGAIQKAADLN